MRSRENKIKDDYYYRVFCFQENTCCVDCGLIDPVVMHFDHRNPAQKFDSVSAMLSQLRPWKMIEDEMKKCDVRCANCHIRRTAKQFGWRKHFMGEGR